MSLLTLLKLKAACEGKLWNENPLYEGVFKNLTNILGNLPDHQSELVLELIEKYRWMSQNEIFESLIKVLKSVPPKKLGECKRIIVFPIMRPKHQNTVKSGHYAMYLIKGLTPYLGGFENIAIKEVIRFDHMTSDNYQAKNSDLIFLVDDYIGSGDTVKSTVENLMAGNSTITHEMLLIITIAIQKDSIELLKNLSIPLLYDHVEMKGISNHYDPEVAEAKKALMLEIEAMIPKCQEYNLGYNRSEALITLTRTPNNTFPLFWKTIRIKNKYYKAPFPRY